MSRVPPVRRDDLDPERRQAYDDEVARVGQVTNMKTAILHSLPAYRAYKSFYGLQQGLRDRIGAHGFDVFAHAISTGSNCLLCSTYFRRQLVRAGTAREDFVPGTEDALLADLGEALGTGVRTLPPELWQRLRDAFDEETIVTLVAFGGTMVATNLFNSVLEIDLDADLVPFLAPAAAPAP